MDSIHATFAIRIMQTDESSPDAECTYELTGCRKCLVKGFINALLKKPEIKQLIDMAYHEANVQIIKNMAENNSSHPN